MSLSRIGSMATIIVALSYVTFPSLGVAQQPGGQSAQTVAAPPVKPGDVELGSSRVYIRVGKTGAGHEHAVVGNLKQSWLKLSPQAAGESQGKLVFDMTTFDADSDAARQYIGLAGSTDASTRKQVNDNMLGKDVLDVRHYPTAEFNATKISKLDKPSPRNLPQYDVEGQFTLHGVTRPIKFTIDVEEVQGWYRVRGAFGILQTQFGMKPYSKLFGAVGVTDKLDIYGDLYVAP
ncbi:MAG: YceI family protein [Pirellulales bacterium]